jgi:phage-related protein
LHKIYFYKDANGKQPVLDYMKKLASLKGKENRIKFNKIQEYIQILSEYGTAAGEPYIKHLEGDIWELRPLKDRILFIGQEDGAYILLHHFIKKTRKTPKREIEKAKRKLQELRRNYHEK